MLAEVETRRNGSGASVPIKTTEIKLDEYGYPGWSVTMRTDPRSSVFDDLTSGEEERWWPAFGKVVIEWYLTDDDGEPLPHPSSVSGINDLDLRIGVLGFILDRYFQAVRVASALPKASSDNSGLTSSTSEGSPTSG